MGPKIGHLVHLQVEDRGDTGDDRLASRRINEDTTTRIPDDRSHPRHITRDDRRTDSEALEQLVGRAQPMVDRGRLDRHRAHIRRCHPRQQVFRRDRRQQVHASVIHGLRCARPESLLEPSEPQQHEMRLLQTLVGNRVHQDLEAPLSLETTVVQDDGRPRRDAGCMSKQVLSFGLPGLTWRSVMDDRDRWHRISGLELGRDPVVDGNDGRDAADQSPLVDREDSSHPGGLMRLGPSFEEQLMRVVDHSGTGMPTRGVDRRG